MNTTAKGDAFEDVVFRRLQQQIKDGCFFARAEWCRLFRKKGYFSKDRNSKIIFDISIEITEPGADSHFLLVLVECKDYSTKVPVNDVEEFWSKVQQVSGANVKAIIASTAAFQAGSLAFAESRGFGVLRCARNGKFKWDLRRAASWSGWDDRAESQEARHALVGDTFVSGFFDCAFFVRGTYTCSSNRMFERLCLHSDGTLADVAARAINPQRRGQPTVPYLEKSAIEAVAAETLASVGHQYGPVPLSRVCEVQSRSCGLSVEETSGKAPDGRTLGSLTYDPLQIRVFESEHSARARFTLAHELGHLLLRHDRFMSGEITEASDLQSDSYSSMAFVDLRRMEWQANFFASCLLLPAESFTIALFLAARRRELYDRGFGLLYVDHQHVNVQNFMAVTAQLCYVFDVSREAVVIRLKEFGYLNDVRVPRNIMGNIGSFDN